MARCQEKFVDLIAHHGDLGMAPQNGGDGLQLRPAEHHAGGVAGAVEHQQLAGGADGGKEVLNGLESEMTPAQIAKATGLPVSGLGGLSTWQDALKASCTISCTPVHSWLAW